MNQETPQAEETVDFRVCNLVNRGMTIAEAKAHLAGTDNQAGEVPTVEVPNDIQSMREALTAAGVEFHPKMKLPKLTQIYNAHFHPEE